MNSKFAARLHFILCALAAVLLLQPKGGTWAWLVDIRWLYVLLLSFVLAQLFTPLAGRLAWRCGVLDMPDTVRKLHGKPIPRLGGAAIFAAVWLSTLRNFQFSRELAGLMTGATLMYLLGLSDDIHPQKATVRLAVQVIAGAIVAWSGTYITLVPVHWPGHLLLDGIVTVIWLIGIANAINFLDGIDGLATGMVALCALLFFSIAWSTRQSHLLFLSAALAGACIGFLPFNWRPASIFLGDAGSTFIGFLIAGIAIMGTWAHNNPVVALSTPLLILGIPIFDMIYTTVARIRQGQVRTFREWLEYAGRDHFHHRLLHLRLTEKETVLFILMVNLCLGLGALVLRDTGTRGAVLLLTQSVLILLVIVILMLLGKDMSDPLQHANKKEKGV